MQTIVLFYCIVEYTDWGCFTRFPDNVSIAAAPHYTPHYHVIAHRLGYGDDVLAYCREHEVCHSLVSEWFEDAPSAVLWDLAHERKTDPIVALREEVMVQLVQRWVRAAERPILADVDWDGLRAWALEVLGAGVTPCR